ncbi:MAG: DNA mismatch repair protein MutS, partial [Clostridia bacterium]|nr:DNA mismatch repair protein MutS [Clostridia bacterium]
MTPMMEQYWEIKNQYKDYIVFYRLGDFYEMFFDDAILASRELELTLTGRDCGEAERAPMCGVPFHSYEGYVGKLIEKNYKVAICEQVEDPALAKGLVRREVIRMITPGTLLESSLLSEQSNNYLCAICMSEFSYGVCFADASTGEVHATSFSGENADARLRAEIGTYAPREVIVNVARTNMGEVGEFLANRPDVAIGDNQYTRFEYASARERVMAQFGEQVKDEYLEDRAMTSAVGALLSYIEEAEKGDISYMRELNVYSDGQYMEMDVNTRRNLELTESLRSKDKHGSL